MGRIGDGYDGRVRASHELEKFLDAEYEAEQAARAAAKRSFKIKLGLGAALVLGLGGFTYYKWQQQIASREKRDPSVDRPHFVKPRGESQAHAQVERIAGFIFQAITSWLNRHLR
jgi:hypothetical protein